MFFLALNIDNLRKIVHVSLRLALFSPVVFPYSVTQRKKDDSDLGEAGANPARYRHCDSVAPQPRGRSPVGKRTGSL